MDIILRTKKSMNSEEVALLMDLIKRNPILTSKETNAATNRIKEDTWNSLTTAFNAKGLFVPRTREQLKLKWENLKKAARSRAKQISLHNLKTDRGEQDFTPRDEILGKVCEILGSTTTSTVVSSDDDSVPLQIDLDATSIKVERAPADTPTKDVETKSKENVCEDSHRAEITGTSKSVFLLKRSKQQRLKRVRKNAELKSRVARNYAIARYFETKKQKLHLEIKLLRLELEEKRNKISK